MNYEKMYKEALERASKIKLRNPIGRIQDEIDSIFPELKESEDERIKKEILELVSISGNGNQFEEIKDWLEKQGEQKPAWSEEDKKMKNLIISTLTSMGTLNLERYHHMNLDEVKKWLKSLKSNHWKPSEEQMGALNYAYCELFKRGENGEGSNCVHPLMTLIDDLKKL